MPAVGTGVGLITAVGRGVGGGNSRVGWGVGTGVGRNVGERGVGWGVGVDVAVGTGVIGSDTVSDTEYVHSSILIHVWEPAGMLHCAE